MAVTAQKFVHQAKFALDDVNDILQRSEVIFSNSVTVFSTNSQKEYLQSLIKDFDILWKDKNCFASTATGEVISINLIPDFQIKYKASQAKVYTTGFKDRKIIDKIFNALHKYDRLYW